MSLDLHLFHFWGDIYTLSFIEYFSMKTQFNFLKKKFEAFKKFKEFKPLIKDQIENKIKVLRTNNE